MCAALNLFFEEVIVRKKTGHDEWACLLKESH
jgi:hypothetical protein